MSSQPPVSPPTALDGVRVLDFTVGVAGPYCTKMLADWGADVIKVERPGRGDPARSWGPFPGDVPNPDKSGLFLMLNQGKRSVTLNLADPSGQELARGLMASSQIVVQSFRPRSLARLGLTWDEISAANPAAVLTSISSFGLEGPYRDYEATDVILYGLGGAMHTTGHRGREPLKIGDNIPSCQAGIAAALATSIALYHAEATGEGDHVDLSIMDTQAGSQDRQSSILLTYQWTGDILERLDPANVATRAWPCRDGAVDIALTGVAFRKLVDLMGGPELSADPRFASVEAWAKPETQELFSAMLLGWLSERTMEEAWQSLQACEIASGPIRTAAQVLEDPHLKARGYWQTLAVEDVPLTLPGRPFIMDATPWRSTRPAPRLGEHTAEVLCGLLDIPLAVLPSLNAAGVI